MTEKLRVTIRPSGAHPDILTVQDAMHQVLDLFNLLGGEGETDTLVWRLSFAGINSPFVAEGEATSLVPGVDITVIARAEKHEFVNGFSEIMGGRVPSNWIGTEKAKIVSRILARNTNGIGQTDIQYDQNKPAIILNRQVAVSSLSLLDVSGLTKIASPLFEGDHSRTEQGSVEGQILQVGTYYNGPAIKFKERKSSAEIWCRVSKEIELQIAKQADFADVWNHNRVILKGEIAYRSDGSIANIFAQSVQRVAPRKVSLSELRDPQFTGGLNVSDYLEKFREGELG